MAKNKIAALCASVCLSLLATSAYAEANQLLAGYNGWTDYDYGYVGGVTALNHDMKADGWLVRSTVGYGEYSYSSMAAGGKVDVDLTNADALVGFQKFLTGFSSGGTGRIALFLGVDYQDHNLNKLDRSNRATGNEFGIKGYGELRLPIDTKVFFNEEGSYSSAFDTYRFTSHLGYYMNNFAVGPELEFVGNNAFDEEHLGLFISDLHLADTLTVALSGGYAHPSRQFKSGAYSNVSLNYGF